MGERVWEYAGDRFSILRHIDFQDDNPTYVAIRADGAIWEPACLKNLSHSNTENSSIRTPLIPFTYDTSVIPFPMTNLFISIPQTAPSNTIRVPGNGASSCPEAAFPVYSATGIAVFGSQHWIGAFTD